MCFKPISSCSWHTLLFIFTYLVCVSLALNVDPKKTIVWGPGLSPVDIVMPARYFFIQSVNSENITLNTSPGAVFDIAIKGHSDQNRDCRLTINTLDRKDGTFICRYKLYQTCHDIEITIKYKGKHVAESPYKFEGPVYSEECYCPEKSLPEWLKKYNCKSFYKQIENDLKPFPTVNFTQIHKDAEETLINNPSSMSICNYVIKNNQIYRECFGKYIGFNMFVDAILLSLTRKARLPDMEMFFNLGDWPLVKASEKKNIPMFSWCGSADSIDIVLPTYDITEAALQCMGRVTLDMLSVQGNIEKTWEEKHEKAFWRGRDSRRERLDLIDIARKNPDLINASLTNFFFFRDEEDVYGPKEKHVSFFSFFDYKYQINIDGTVAAYRFPYLLAGDSLVLKQDSFYYEHFYGELEKWTHFVPVKSDLSDLVDQINWAKTHDAEAKSISRQGQKFARENLMPHDIFCYHAVLFQEFSERLISPVEVRNTMDHVAQPAAPCNCHKLSQVDSKVTSRDEL